MTATLTPPADLLRKISEPGINVNLPGLVDRTRTLQQEELVLIEQLNEITDFPSLKKANPSEFKKDSSFNPRSKKHINAYLRAQGQTELNSVREDMLEQHLPHDLSNTLMAARRKRKFTTDICRPELCRYQARPNHGASKITDGQIMQGNSVRFVRFVFHPCVYRDPVYFPSLAPIIRVCLFKAARIRSNIRDDETNKNGSTIKCLLVEKLAAPVFELADCGLGHHTAVDVGKIEAPLAGLGIVET